MPNEPQPDSASASTASSASAAAAEAAAEAAAAARRMRTIVRVTVGVIVALFVYTVFADRITPYTSQASIDTFLVQIAPEINGPVVAVGVRDNQPVKKGQMLFQINPAAFEVALRSAQASVAVAVLGAESSSADVRVADATLQRHRVDLAASQQLGEIVFGLTAKKALSETMAIRARADIDKSRAEIGKAEAEAERARIRLGQTGNDNAQVRQALASEESAKLDLQRTTVAAPADGVITNLRLAPGQYANKGQPVMSFVADGPRWLTAAMRENQLGNIAPGNRALVVFDDHPGQVFTARVESVGWGVAQGDDAPSGQLQQIDAPKGWLREPQSFPVRIVLDSPAAGAEKLPPGRSGAQANVVVLTRETSLMNPLARMFIRMVALLSYLQ